MAHLMVVYIIWIVPSRVITGGCLCGELDDAELFSFEVEPSILVI